jgi:hypothetical protein
MNRDRAVLPAHAVEVGTEPLARPERNSVGGRPFLDEAQERPQCFCGERITLFFQLDIPRTWSPSAETTCWLSTAGRTRTHPTR